MTTFLEIISTLPIGDIDSALWPQVRAADDACAAAGCSSLVYPNLRTGELEITVERDAGDGEGNAVEARGDLPLSAWLDAPQDVRDWMYAEVMLGQIERLTGERCDP